MKSVILLALVAFAAAGPVQKLPIVVATPEKVVVVTGTTPTTGFYSPGLYGFFGEQYGTKGKIFEVAQYIAYQFHLIQELGYTPSQVATYFLEYGFPQYVVDYLVKIYEAGLSEPYFRSPYLIFQYFSEYEFPVEVQDYIFREIVQALHVFQNYFVQYGQKAFEYEFPGVSPLFSKYVVHLGRYYYGEGFTYSRAHMIYEQLQLVERYFLDLIRFFESTSVPVEVYQYVYRLLKESLVYIQSAQSAFQTYQIYQQKYLPYYFAQYYSYQVAQAFQYFSNIYQYIQQYQGSLPQYFIEQVRLAYFALQKVYYIIYSSSYGYGGYGPYSSIYGYMPYTSSYGFGSYSPYYSYGYQYGPYSSSYGYGSYYPYSSSYGYGSYYPYSSSYGYPYGRYSGSYGLDSSYGYYGPYSSYAKYGSYIPSYKYGSYTPYMYLGSKGYGGYPYSYYPYSSYGYQYGPYSSSYGYYGPYSSSYKYGSYSPYTYGSGSYMGYSGYPYYYGQISAAAA